MPKNHRILGLNKNAVPFLMIKAVLFDCINTICPLTKEETTIFETCRKALYDFLREKKVIKSDFITFKHKYKEFAQELQPQLDNDMIEISFNERIELFIQFLGITTTFNEKFYLDAAHAFYSPFFHNLTIAEGVHNVLRQLKLQNYKIGLVSLFPFSPPLIDFLRKNNLLPHFDSIVISADIGFRKPHPRIFHHCLDELNVHANDAVFIGDSPYYDIEGATNAGMITVLLWSEKLQDLEPINALPDYIIYNLHDIEKILEDLTPYE